MSFGVDPNSGLPTILAGGEPRVLARLAPTPGLCRAPRYTGQVLPESQWQEVDAVANGWVPEIYDQNGQGSCVGHGSVTAFATAWLRNGNAPQRFSPCYLYSLINGGRDNGAVVEDALHALERNGVCLESTVGLKKIYPSQFNKSAADAEALRFRIEQAEKLDTFAEIASAVTTGSTVSFGTDIGRNFDPDSQGIIPRLSGSGGGHCMAAVGLKKINGVWYLQVPNSWSPRWGLNGICYMESSYFQGYVDAFRIDAALPDPQEPQGPVAG